MNVLKMAGVLVLTVLAALSYGFDQLRECVDRLLLWGGANAAHLCVGAVGDLSKIGGETTRVRMLKTVSSPHATWFSANKEEGRDGLYDVDAETARAWLRDGVAEAVGSEAKAEAKDAAGDDLAPRAEAVDPANLQQAQPVHAAVAGGKK